MPPPTPVMKDGGAASSNHPPPHTTTTTTTGDRNGNGHGRGALLHVGGGRAGDPSLKAWEDRYTTCTMRGVVYLRWRILKSFRGGEDTGGSQASLGEKGELVIRVLVTFSSFCCLPGSSEGAGPSGSLPGLGGCLAAIFSPSVGQARVPGPPSPPSLLGIRFSPATPPSQTPHPHPSTHPQPQPQGSALHSPDPVSKSGGPEN